MRKTLLFCLATFAASMSFANGITVNLGAYAHQYSGLKNMEAYTKAEHDIEIINDTDNAEEFTYGYSYCADFSGKCVNTGGGIKVAPHSRWNNHHDSYLNVTYKYEGNYNLVATTSVQGKVSKTYNAYGTIIVR